MQNYNQGDVVRVPFPYTDKQTRQHRPALVVSSGTIGEHGALLWVVMITSAENRTWPGDVAIPHHDRAGLPAPSVVRTLKIATIEARHAEQLGKLSKATLDNVMRQIQASLSAPRKA
jgi:mRNA interferase MazF